MESIRKTPDGFELRTHVQPQASKSEFAGTHGDRLKIRIQAKPVDGEANAAIIKFLSKAAGVPKSQIELLRGATSRDKDFRISLPGATEKEIDAVMQMFQSGIKT
jgi:uncharacterized protein